MKRLALAAILAALTVVNPAYATDIITMTDTERDVFRAEVRAYLMENPEVLLEAIAVLEDRQATEAASNDTALLLENADAIYNDGFSYVGGNPDGDITIVEFSDYRCPYCKRAHPEVTELLASDGNIRLIYKEFPILGPESLTTAQFAMATLMVEGPEAYEKVSAALMNLRGAPSSDALTMLAKEFDLDAAALLEKMKSAEVTQAIQANRALGQRLQISGTPTFILGDELVRGYVPLDAMRELVAEARGE
jgi:protein-disulfide isomerase